MSACKKHHIKSHQKFPNVCMQIHTLTPHSAVLGDEVHHFKRPVTEFNRKLHKGRFDLVCGT